MTSLSLPRRLLKRFHPEAIPWPGTIFYNAISATAAFQGNYALVAEHIAGFCSAGKILDIGTGPGRLLVQLHRLAPHVQPIGLDASPSMVAAARKNIAAARLSEKIKVKEGNANDLPFHDESFDGVVSTGSIHHWKEAVAGLDEAYRVLKPGKYALMYDVVSDTPASIFASASRQFGRVSTLLFWLHAFEEPFYTRRAFQALARASMFRRGRTEFVGLLCCLILQK